MYIHIIIQHLQLIAVSTASTQSDPLSIHFEATSTAPKPNVQVAIQAIVTTRVITRPLYYY